MQFGLTPRRWLILNAAGVGQFQPGVGAPATTPGTTQDKRKTMKGFAARGTLSGFDGLILCHPQGCRCAPNPGLKLANAFGVKNPGLKLANAFDVNSKRITPICIKGPELISWQFRSLILDSRSPAVRCRSADKALRAGYTSIPHQNQD